MPDAVIVVHPHPSMGGDSSHPFVVTVAAMLRAAGFVTVEPDLRDPDVATSARDLDEIASAVDCDRLFFVGYSWGSVVASHANPPRLAARVLVAPPGLMTLGDLTTLPTFAIIPENDQYGGALLPVSVMTEVVPRADHFLWGFVDDISTRCVDWLRER